MKSAGSRTCRRSTAATYRGCKCRTCRSPRPMAYRLRLPIRELEMLLTKVSGTPIEVKAVGDAGEIEGYGSIFGNVDSYGEMVMPGAFSASLVDARRKGRSVKMLWQHNPDQPIGV